MKTKTILELLTLSSTLYYIARDNQLIERIEELNEKIEQQVVKFYKKINVAHLDEIKALHEKIDKLDATVALLEARINHLES